MKLGCIAMTLILFTAVTRGSEAPPIDKERKREVRGRVLAPDGKPAPGRHITLVGLTRDSMHPRDEVYLGESAWDFKSDGEGRFTAVFWGEPGAEREKVGKILKQTGAVPGWGRYALVVEPGPDDAGGVSPLIEYWEPDQTSSDWSFSNEWGVPILLPPDGLDMNIQVTEGYSLKGKVLDYEHPESPLAGVAVYLEHDLHADTHSNWGGDIFRQEEVTDKDGYYRFEHVYPGTVYPELRSSKGKGGTYQRLNWLKTAIDGEPRPDAGYKISLSEVSRRLDFVVTDKKLFRYYGRVTNSDGNVAANVAVNFGWSDHPREETFIDSHQSEVSKTDEAGHFDVMLGTPWCLWISTGLNRSGTSLVGKPTLSPGEYNLIKRD